MKNIMHLLDVIDGVRDSVALGLMSDPGLSKTAQVKQWAEEHGRTYCELIISQRMPSEISGMPMPVAESGTMQIFDFETLLKLKDGDVLAFDEFTNGNIQTLNACLTLIQERTMLSGKKLPSLVIVAMGNPQGKCDLLPQTKQRFWWVDVSWDADTWSTYMSKTWGVTPHSRLLKAIKDQYQKGFADIGQYNYFTPRTVENLFKISKTIEPTDPFWTASDVDPGIVESFYLTTQNVDKFRQVQTQLIEWVTTQKQNPWTLEVMTVLAACESMSELRLLIKSLEEEGIAVDFIDYLKSNPVPGESDE